MLRGVLAIIFGVLTFIWPGLTLLTLVMLYGAFAFVDGAFALAAAVTKGAPAPRWWLAVVGIVGIGAGIATLLWPGITGVVLLYFIAVWAIVAGIFQIIGAIKLRAETSDEWMLITAGVLSVVFGVLILLFPEAGALGLSFGIATFAIAYGVLLIAFSLRLKKHAAVRI